MSEPQERDSDSHWRKICRWYSKNFYTPLHTINDLPRLDVLQAYYEDVYNDMSDVELHDEAQRLLKPHDLDAKLEQAIEDKAIDLIEKEVKEANKNKKSEEDQEEKIERLDVSPEMLESLSGIGKALQDIGSSFDNGFGLDN